MIGNREENSTTVTHFTGSLEDRLVRQPDCQGNFSVIYAYKVLNSHNKQVDCLPWKLIWKVNFQTKWSVLPGYWLNKQF